MPKLNEADADRDLDRDAILGINNLQLTSDETVQILKWFATSKPVAPESVKELFKLIEMVYNLGHAHMEDTKEQIDIFIAADYVPIDVNKTEDTEEEAAS